MTRAHGVLALLLAVALAWAYALTRPEWWPAGDANRPVPLWTLDARDVLRVEYSEGGSRVVLKSDTAQRLSDGAPAWWIDAEGPAAAAEAPPAPPQRPLPGKLEAPGRGAHPAAPGTKSTGPANAPGAKLAPPGAAAPSGSTVAPKPGAPERASFRGGVVAANLVRELARLSALREIGHVDARQLQAFGLDKPVGTLLIERATATAARSAEAPRGEPLRLDLGIATVAGGTRYAVLQPGGRVFIIPQVAFRQMEHARRLMDREWLPFNLLDAKRIEARMGKRKLTLWRLDLPPTVPQRWARKPDAKQGEPAALNWLRALAGVKVLDTLGAGAFPLGPEPAFEVTVYRGSQPAAGAPVGSPASAPGGASPTSGNAASTEPPDQPVVLRIYPAGGRAGGKAEPERLNAVSTYTSAPVAVSGPAVRAVLDQARALLDSP